MKGDKTAILIFAGLSVALGIIVCIVVMLIEKYVFLEDIRGSQKTFKRNKELIKERDKSEEEAIESSKVYLKYGKDFRGEYFFSGLFLMMFTVMICLFFFVPAMEYRIELFGETVSEQEPTLLKMISEAKNQLDDIKIHSIAESFAFMLKLLPFLLDIGLFLYVALNTIIGLICFIQQTYYMFVNKEEYEKFIFMNYRGLSFVGKGLGEEFNWKFYLKLNANKSNRETILFLTFAIPLMFVFYGVFRAVYYHAEKDELLEDLGIHMTMTVGMIFVIILAVLCLVCGICFMMKYKNTKQKIMQEPIECETTETTETST